MQAEMLKLNEQFLSELKKSQPKNVPVAVAQPVSVAAQEQEDRPSAAELDAQRREAQAQRAETQPAVSAPQVVTQTVAPVQQQPPPQIANTQTSAPAPAPVSGIRTGDVVGVGDLDVIPKPVRVVAPIYPPMARSQRLAATIILSVFIDENGQVDDVRVLRGEPRYGMSESAVRAMKATRFSSPMKDGKKVKTWLPQQIDFKP